ncbi:AAA family ATPase [Stieleria varia]|uniref:ATP-dependent Clp protease ATP-binding subunit ClpE n=1 Tax=Stieleria varia TaxID=2528005 RepID=A0A5C6B3U4_9BACT|nr:ATP-dependent Clp protease ATP-binding subunit [Stieleria varia]TWU06151.1 ATP-dependent Clp protease ATP-binding subunit ClpE [Stieleria varia]
MDSIHPELVPTFVAAKRHALRRHSQAIELPDLFHALVESNPVFRDQLILQGFVPIESVTPADVEIDESQRVTLAPDLKSIIEELSTTGDRKVRMGELLQSLEPLLQDKATTLFQKGDRDPSELSVAPIIKPESQPEPETIKLPVLESLAREMTPAKLKNPIVGRSLEVSRLSRILTKRYAPNPILVGEPGVGKTAVVEGFVAMLGHDSCPKALRGRRVFQISATDLVAGTGIHGSIEKRIKELVEELEMHGDKIILFVDEIHQLVVGGGNSNPGDMLKPALGRGIFPCIGATTLREFNLMERHDPAFCRRFEILPVKEPTEPETIQILKGLSDTLFSHHDLPLPSDELLQTCVELCRDHLSHRRFPDKAINLLDSACALAASETAPKLQEHHLRSALAERTGVSSIANRELYRESLADLGKNLAKRIVGQDDAIQSVCKKITTCKLQLDLRPARPDGVFLFTGPSGVGKTEFARQLSRLLTDDKSDSLIFVAMSEYRSEADVQKLFGSPPSYVGYGEPTKLEREVRRFQSGVLLLDEFEKAHPSVQIAFLNAFEEGRITFGSGQVVAISHVTVIATANFAVGADKPKFGWAIPGEETEAREDIRSEVPDVLINRFDEVIEFKSISKKHARNILTDIILAHANRNYARHEIQLELSEDALSRILDQGYHPDFGVRNLQRSFESLVQPLVVNLLTQQTQDKKGLWTVDIRGADNEVILVPAATPDK